MVKSKNDIVFNCVVYFIIALVGLVCLVPVLFVISASFTPYSELLKHGGFVLIPSKITTIAYTEILADGALYNAMGVTVRLTIVGTACNLIVTLLLAYALSRHDVPLTGFFMRIIMFCMLFSAGTVPTYLVVRKMGLIDTFWAMIVPGLVSVYNLVIMKSFFEGLPEELFEAARIDGASETRVLINLVLPLSLPIVMTIGMYYAVDHWNTYMAAVLYIMDEDLKPLQVILRRLLDKAKNQDDVEFLPNETLKMAAVCFATAPIIVVYPFIQKYFVKGTLAGAVKG